MKFSYQMNHRELSKALKMLGTPIVGAWVVYLVVAVSMFPSIVLFSTIGAEMSLGWFSLMAICILLAAAWAYIKRTGYPSPWNESIELLDGRLGYCFGYSRVECRWNVIDRIEELEEGIAIYCYGRPWLIPNRVLGDQKQKCLEYLEMAKTRGKDETNLPPVPIYQEFILANSASGYRYQVTADDLAQAARESFQSLGPDPVSANRVPRPKNGSYGQCVLIMLLLLLVSQIIYFSAGAAFVFRSTSVLMVGLSIAGWILPVVWLVIWRKWSWLFRIRAISQKIPKLESTLKLTSSCWVIANPNGGTLGDWRDVLGIIQSERFLGLKMINQLAYLIPKKIFPSTTEAEAFLGQVLEHLQNSRLSTFETVSNQGISPIAETNNPYQSPVS